MGTLGHALAPVEVNWMCRLGTELWPVVVALDQRPGPTATQQMAMKPVLPPRILERLRLGREVAAEIPPTLPDHRAWVHVEPVLDPQLGQMQQREYGLESILISYGEENPLIGFRLRRREIHRRFEDSPDDWDLVGLSVDEVCIVKSEDEVAVRLTTWHADLDALTLPHHVDSPF